MPRKKKDIENYDFIFVFEGDVTEQLVLKLQSVEQLMADRQIKHVLFYSKSDKQTYLLVALQDPELVYRQAENLKILKQKDKRSFRLSQ